MFKSLGCKLLEGADGEAIPLKDVATSDALLLREPPAPDDEYSRATLAALAKGGLHCIVPAAALAANPLPGAVALVELADLEAKLLLRTGGGADGGAATSALGDAVLVAGFWLCVPADLEVRLCCPPAGDSGRLVVTVRGDESDEQLATLCAREAEVDLLLVETPERLSRLHASRRLFNTLKERRVDLPVVHHLRTPAVDSAELALRLGVTRAPTHADTSGPRRHAPRRPCAPSHPSTSWLCAGMQAGSLLGDGLGDGILIEAEREEGEAAAGGEAVGGGFDIAYLRETSFALLQGSRMRNTKTEFVSCPSCGRTLFDLQEVTAQISERTGHLPGVTVAIMGCIVNGPGEMADADFGYVGGAPGKVDLYVGKTVVQRAIPNEVACDALVELIKEHGMWKDKEEEEEEEEEGGEEESKAALEAMAA